jgi:transposase
MEWFKEKEVDLFPIPPNSPDLNLMENVWGMLARRVYHEQKSFHNVNELKNAIILAWDSIKIEELRPILASMPERLFQVAAKRGGMTTF